MFGSNPFFGAPRAIDFAFSYWQLTIQLSFLHSHCRLVTLSFPPFLVVHANMAFAMQTGVATNEILGLPLQDCLKKAFQGTFSDPVTSMHGQIATFMRRPKSSRRGTEESSHKLRKQCRVKIYLVGPETEEEEEAVVTNQSSSQDSSSSDNNDEQEKEQKVAGDVDFSTVTHFGVELIPVRDGKVVDASTRRIEAGNERLLAASPGSYCGILG